MVSRLSLRTLAALMVLLGLARPVLADDDTWVGRQVMPRDTCVPKIKAREISPMRLSLPLTVEKVKGDWLWTGAAWVKPADVVPLADAIAYYTKCIRKDPKSSWAYSCRGVARGAQGDTEGARRDFDIAASLDPTNPTADPENLIEKFPVPRNGDFLLLPVVIGGQKHLFVVDTGSSWCVVDNSLSAHLVSTGRTGVVNGHAGVEAYTLPDAFVGASRLPITAEVVCNDLQSLRKWSGYDIRGFLGMNFLMSYAISVDFDAGVLAILKHGPESAEEALGLSYADNGIPTIEFELPGKIVVPFRLDSGMGGAGRFEPETFSLIKGTGRMTQLKRPGRFVTVHGEEARREALVDQFAIDRFEHPALLFSEGAANALGLDLLSRYAATFDFPNQRLFLKAGRRFAEPPRFDMSGVALSRVGDATIVEWVCRSSPAADSGVQAGDRVLFVNGKRAADYTLFELERLRSQAGQKLRLAVRGQKNARNVDLVLADWQKIDPKLRAIASADRQPQPSRPIKSRPQAEPVQPARGEKPAKSAILAPEDEIPELKLAPGPDADSRKSD